MWGSQRIIKCGRLLSLAIVLAGALTLGVGSPRAAALTKIPDPVPEPGSYGLVAFKEQAPPTTAATITTPRNGGSFSTSPVTVSGLCTKGLLVQVYDNGVMVGAIDCTSGSFRIQVSLYTGTNVLSATQFDDLNQAGPDSNHVTVTYNNAHFTAFGQLITLTSNYGRRAADPGKTLDWPLQLSGGTGPYAFSIDWGDGSPAQLKSQALAGVVTISHVYDKSGVYHVTVRVTDTNGASAFLQLVGVANGTPVANNTNSNTTTVTVVKVVWIPALVCLLLLIPAFWLGRRSELVSLRKRLEKDMQNYHEI